MIDSVHPARSSEFLSRLHDGELSAADLASFETHRAGCAECRDAVAAFERSLDAFRAAPPAPVPADLSARILRKIRAQTPTRRPFGVMFGIDIRWAGVFLAALLVAIIAPALLYRREARPAAVPEPPLRAYVVDSDAPRQNAPVGASARAKVAPPQSAEDQERKAQTANDQKEEKLLERDKDKADSGGTRAPLQAAAPAAPESGVARDRFELRKSAPAPEPHPLEENAAAPPPAAAPAAPARRSASASTSTSASGRLTAEKPGGEAGSFAKDEQAAQDIHLDIRAFDANGTAPELLSKPTPESLAPLRGQDFVLTVEADGAVQSVVPARREDERAQATTDAAAKSVSAAATIAPLQELRFQSTGRPRKLFVRVR